MSEIFEMELYRKDKIGASATLKLPATPFEIADALDKLRITDKTAPYQVEILSCKPDYLSAHISENVNLHELNHLAQHLAALSDWELDCFEGMVTMNAVKKDDTLIPLERLINMTHSTADCQIAFEAHNDRQLGKFYVDNGMAALPDNLPEAVYELLDYEAIGRKARIAEGGVFTGNGYVVLSGEVSQAYHEGSAVPHEKPNYTVMLEVCKGWFSDSEYNSGASEYPLLPADDGMIDRVLGQLDTASAEECSFRAVDCIVPKLTALISDSLYESNGDCYGAVNELSEQLKKLDETGKLPIYRAMIEAAPNHLMLEDTIDLAKGIDWFQLLPEVTSPRDYALHQLNKYQIECADDLYRGCNLYDYGKKLMEQNGVCLTDYGLLWTMSTQPVQEMLCPSGHEPLTEKPGMKMG